MLVSSDLIPVKPLSEPNCKIHFIDHVYDLREIRKNKLLTIFKNNSKWIQRVKEIQ
jgi:hypothetical protein